MDKHLLIFILALGITAIGFMAMAKEKNIDWNNLMSPPEIIKYQGVSHAIFDLGGMQYLYKLTSEISPYPQCDSVQRKGKELLVVAHSPKGYAYFVEGNPIAFKTHHNPNWNEIVKHTHKKDD